MIYTTKGFYHPKHCRQTPHVLWVFGDNQQRLGHGGQAIIRDEPNAFGVATKRSCSEYMDGTLADFEAVLRDLRNLEPIMVVRATILPILADGNISLGCGLADLPNRSPALYGMINEWFHSLTIKKEVQLP